MIKNFPFYHQLDAMDCGATCLRMIARYYGRYYSLEQLRELMQMGKQGVSLLGISDAAEEIGFQSLAVKASIDRLIHDVPMPCIAHWQQEHFVVVYRTTPAYIYISDPALGQRRLTHAEFMAGWISDEEDGEALGILLLLETTPEFDDRDGQGIDKSGIGYIYAYFKQYQYLILQLVIGIFIGSLLQLVLPFLVKSLIDVGIGNVDVNFIGLILSAQLVLFLAQTGIELLRRWILLYVSIRVNVRLISDYLIKLTRLPLRFFDTRLTADVLHRIADHERIERFLTSTSLTSIFSVINFLVFSLVLLYWSPAIFLVFAGGSALYAAWFFLFQRRQRELDYKHFDQAADNQNQLVELINGMREIKLHNAEKQKRWNWESNQAKLYRTNIKALSIDQIQRTGATMINESKNLIIIFICATSVLNGSMTMGMLVAILYVIGQLNAPVQQFIEFMRAWQEAKISLERMNEIHLREDEESLTDKIVMLPEFGDLVLDRVSFRYPGANSPQILKRISLQIPKGRTTAIVGSSGSGKTTLLKLLLNFYKPTEGAIRLGDVNLNNVHSRLWRNQCGIVMQDSYLFNDTIARNIALGDNFIDKQKLLRAVKVANIQSYVESLPLGYNTKIGPDGQELSQGQRQRLLLARLIYKDPEYIFFDEATSSLDSFNEMVVMENLEEFFKGKTIVIVAHRLNTIRNADQIVVLDAGEVVEQGDHDSLTYQRGAYYHLIRSQLELGA